MVENGVPDDAFVDALPEADGDVILRDGVAVAQDEAERTCVAVANADANDVVVQHTLAKESPAEDAVIRFVNDMGVDTEEGGSTEMVAVRAVSK